jgi:TolB-like protein/Tfp pilus assembly protein PilF
MIAKKGRAMILDFGLAKVAGKTRITKTGTTLGTVSYMSPEQAKGEEVDHRTDIWSLGIILYEMLTGKLPFKGDYEQAIVYSILNEEPKPLTTYLKDAPVELEMLMKRCLSKYPTDRYQSANDVLVELQSIKKKIKITKAKLKASASASMPSIAVLPFRDMSPQQDQEYFCEGMAEELINSLVQVDGLRVAARTSVFQFKGAERDIQKIGQQLGVKAVLEGSVRKAGNQLRITTQLISVDDGYHLWGEKYDRNMEDVFAIQDEISLAIVDKLKIKLLEKTKLVKRHTEDMEAYNLYLKGRYFWQKRTEESLKKSINYFQQAIDKNPLYGLAYTGLADSFNVLPWFSNIPPRDAYPKAKAAAVRALEIDDTLAEAHTSYAWSIMFHDWDWVNAEKEFKHAIDLNPSYSTGHHWYAFYLSAMGRHDEAIAAIKHSQELDPLSFVINEDLGMLLYYANRYEEAIEAFQKTLEIYPDFRYTHLYLGWVYTQKTMFDKAMQEYEKELTVTTVWDPFIEAWMGYTSARMGAKDKAEEALVKISERLNNSYLSPYILAISHHAIGEHDRCIEYLGEALNEGHILLCFLKVDPIFKNLHENAKFKGLFKKMNLETRP